MIRSDGCFEDLGIRENIPASFIWTKTYDLSLKYPETPFGDEIHTAAAPDIDIFESPAQLDEVFRLIEHCAMESLHILHRFDEDMPVMVKSVDFQIFRPTKGISSSG